MRRRTAFALLLTGLAIAAPAAADPAPPRPTAGRATAGGAAAGAATGKAGALVSVAAAVAAAVAVGTGAMVSDVDPAQARSPVITPTQARVVAVRVLDEARYFMYTDTDWYRQLSRYVTVRVDARVPTRDSGRATVLISDPVPAGFPPGRLDPDRSIPC